MKYLRCFLLILFLTIMQINGSLGLGAGKVAERVTDSKLLAKILTQSEIMLINELNQKIEKRHIVRIFKLPYLDGDRTETELISGYDIYVGVCEFDEEPEFNVFHIGKIGEIKQIIWDKSFFDGKKDVSHIIVKTTEYSNLYYRYHPKLRVKRETLNLNVTADTISMMKNYD
jgi:hypothetical protein